MYAITKGNILFYFIPHKVFVIIIMINLSYYKYVINYLFTIFYSYTDNK